MAEEKKIKIVIECDRDYVNGILAVSGLTYNISEQEKKVLNCTLDKMEKAPINLDEILDKEVAEELNSVKMALVVLAVSKALSK